MSIAESLNAHGLRRATPDDRQPLETLQEASYAPNRILLGVEPLPLLADYREIIRDMECWITGDAAKLTGALILEWKPDAMLIWSISTAPEAHGRGIGNALMAFAEQRAVEEKQPRIVLYTGEPLTSNIAWYQRLGFTIDTIEAMPDRRIVHMSKTIQSKTIQLT